MTAVLVLGLMAAPVGCCPSGVVLITRGTDKSSSEVGLELVLATTARFVRGLIATPCGKFPTGMVVSKTGAVEAESAAPALPAPGKVDRDDDSMPTNSTSDSISMRP